MSIDAGWYTPEPLLVRLDVPQLKRVVLREFDAAHEAESGGMPGSRRPDPDQFKSAVLLSFGRSRCAGPRMASKKRRDASLVSPGSAMRYVAISLIAGILITASFISGGLQILEGIAVASSRVTVIHKNQTLPSIGELEARATEAEGDTDNVNNDDPAVRPWRSQWI